MIISLEAREKEIPFTRLLETICIELFIFVPKIIDQAIGYIFASPTRPITVPKIQLNRNEQTLVMRSSISLL